MIKFRIRDWVITMLMKLEVRSTRMCVLQQVQEHRRKGVLGKGFTQKKGSLLSLVSLTVWYKWQMTFHFHPFPYVISSWFILCSSLDGVGQEAEDGTDPQQNGEAAKQLTTELDPLGGGGGWSQGVGSISGQILCCLRIGQTLSNQNRKIWGRVKETLKRYS